MDRNNIRKFALSSENLRIKDLISREFLELELNAISDANPNDNRSFFELEAIQDAVPSIKNKPVLGSFDPTKGKLGDFNGHNDNGLRYDPELESAYFDYSAKNSERIIGVVRESDKAYIAFDEVTNLHWLKFTCCIWCAYSYSAVKSLLKARKGRSNVSVEIEVLDSYVREDGVEVIKKFNFLGVTILGADVRPGIAGAALSVLDFVEHEDYEKNRHCLDFAYNALDEYNKKTADSSIVSEKGGVGSMEKDKEIFAGDPAVETEACGKASCACGDPETKEEESCGKTGCACGDPENKQEEACGKAACACDDPGCDCNDPEDKEDEACGGKESESCGKVGCACGDGQKEEPNKEEESCGKVGCACGDGKKEEEACGKTGCACGDPEPAKEEEACGKASCACGDGEPCDGKEEPCDGKEEPEKEEESCGKVGCACGKGCNELQFATVDVDGEQLDVNQLYERYSELREKYEALDLSVKADNAERLVTFGADRISQDEIPTSVKEDLIAKVSDKCKSFEFTTKEQVEEYATNLLAVYFYTNKKAEKSQNDKFSISIERSQSASAPKASALELSIKALERI